MHFLQAIITLWLLITCGCAKPQAVQDYTALRKMMVRGQLISRGIQDNRVLTAMGKVERHLFVPPDQAARAYGDYPLPIGYGQTISQPYIVAFMTEALHVSRHMKVLEIGTGSGYQAAILAELCDSVFTVEIVPELAQKAKNLLTVLGYDHVLVKTGDGYQGWAQHAPFQAVIVTCSPVHVPDPLIDQLAEGGRMIIPIGERNNQQLVILVKKNGRLNKSEVLPVRFVPMVNERQEVY
jgi:protein-L-isoaspartate(D-aspartate) O-methyltransferase